MTSEKFTFPYITPDGCLGANSDGSVAIFALNAFVTSLKSDRPHEADQDLWTGKVLKQERTGKNAYTATIIFTKK
jgi:hypothetical protein